MLASSAKLYDVKFQVHTVWIQENKIKSAQVKVELWLRLPKLDQPEFNQQ
jgi:hypothetical protein